MLGVFGGVGEEPSRLRLRNLLEDYPDADVVRGGVDRTFQGRDLLGLRPRRGDGSTALERQQFLQQRRRYIASIGGIIPAGEFGLSEDLDLTGDRPEDEDAQFLYSRLGGGEYTRFPGEREDSPFFLPDNPTPDQVTRYIEATGDYETAQRYIAWRQGGSRGTFEGIDRLESLTFANRTTSFDDIYDYFTRGGSLRSSPFTAFTDEGGRTGRSHTIGDYRLSFYDDDPDYFGITRGTGAEGTGIEYGGSQSDNYYTPPPWWNYVDEQAGLYAWLTPEQLASDIPPDLTSRRAYLEEIGHYIAPVSGQDDSYASYRTQTAQPRTSTDQPIVTYNTYNTINIQANDVQEVADKVGDILVEKNLDNTFILAEPSSSGGF